MPLHNVFPLNAVESVKTVPDIIRYKGAIYARLALAESDLMEITSKEISEGKDADRHTNEFIKKGMAWNIRFKGEDVGSFTGKGMDYIQTLLSNPDKQINYHELRGGKPNVQNVDESIFIDGSDEQIGSIHKSLSRGVDVGDEQIRREMMKRIKKLNEDRNSDEEKLERLISDDSLNEEKIKELEKKIEKVDKELKDLEKIGKEYRKNYKVIDANEKRLRGSIQAALDRSIVTIAECHEELATHLNKYIKRKNGTVEYCPPSDMNWVTNR